MLAARSVFCSAKLTPCGRNKSGRSTRRGTSLHTKLATFQIVNLSTHKTKTLPPPGLRLAAAGRGPAARRSRSAALAPWFSKCLAPVMVPHCQRRLRSLAAAISTPPAGAPSSRQDYRVRDAMAPPSQVSCPAAPDAAGEMVAAAAQLFREQGFVQLRGLCSGELLARLAAGGAADTGILERP
jgi:hypothetical protein